MTITFTPQPTSGQDVSADLSAAIAKGQPVFVPGGSYPIKNSVAPITASGQLIFGDSQYATRFVVETDTPTVFTFEGGAGRQNGGGFRDIGFDCAGMKSGTLIVTSYTWDFILERVTAFNAWCALLCRQYNNLILDKVRFEGCRGDYAVKAFSDGSTRNGETDRSDLLNMMKVIITGSQTTDLLWLDGFIQTLNFNSLILLKGRNGLRCTNTPNVSVGNQPSFIYGENLQIEGCAADGLHADALGDLYVNGIYSNLHGGDGAYFGPAVYRATLANGVVAYNKGWGLNATTASVVHSEFVTYLGNSLGDVTGKVRVRKPLTLLDRLKGFF